MSAAPADRFQFPLKSLFLVTTVVAISFGVARATAMPREVPYWPLQGVIMTCYGVFLLHGVRKFRRVKNDVE